jgi:hypothetical protein
MQHLACAQSDKFQIIEYYFAFIGWQAQQDFVVDVVPVAV